MSLDMRKRRRQVAWICFEPYLDQAQLIESIKILEQHYQQDSISNMIAYISKICSEFAIDALIKKTIYGQFHQLMEQESVLTIDPLTLIQNSTLETTPNAKHKAVAETLATPDTKPAYYVVLAKFLTLIVNAVSEPSEFFTILIEMADEEDHCDSTILNAWKNTPNEFDWLETLPEDCYHSLVHLVYTVLCELSGPIAADEYFHKAIQICQGLPEAKQFSIARLL
ncbi:hypothetical protein [Methylocucumis oryzae]|uniref:Uncharacterized protein n=1 Tax=Methylocucumis oryzae TaxID=1632867 RepID=A0A0F3IKU9_9GAMM|nr:hypothetical protein [Methylocucumis oryzae]KJV07148.1 hypothetical protein VZ94_06655 [Methylocucumis oryzae]